MAGPRRNVQSNPATRSSVGLRIAEERYRKNVARRRESETHPDERLRHLVQLEPFLLFSLFSIRLLASQRLRKIIHMYMNLSKASLWTEERRSLSAVASER